MCIRDRTCDFTELLYYGTSKGSVVLVMGDKNIRVKVALGIITDVTHDFDKKIIFFSNVSRDSNLYQGSIGYFSLIDVNKIKFIYSK